MKAPFLVLSRIVHDTFEVLIHDFNWFLVQTNISFRLTTLNDFFHRLFHFHTIYGFLIFFFGISPLKINSRFINTYSN